MATEEFKLLEMSRRAAALSDERDSLTAQLRGSSSVPRSSRAVRRAPAAADGYAGLSESLHN
jgi:hypothetical protein